MKNLFGSYYLQFIIFFLQSNSFTQGALCLLITCHLNLLFVLKPLQVKLVPGTQTMQG